MRKLILLAAVVGFAISGCATSIPPPKITDTTYENYKYEFGMDIPDGWDAINLKDAKDFLSIGEASVEKIEAIFVNHSTNSLVFVGSYTHSLNPGALLFVVKSKMEKLFKDDLENTQKNIDTYLNEVGRVASYKQEIKNLKCQYGPCLMSINNFFLQDKQEKAISNIESRIYYYRCHDDDLCIVNFSLSSAPVLPLVRN